MGKWLNRKWSVRIVAKQELDPGYLITMREHPVGQLDDRPYWTYKAVDGGLLNLTVTAAEFAALQVGEILTIRITAETPGEVVEP